MGRPRKQEIELTGTERASLSDLVRSRSAPQGLVRRARIVLASAVGTSNTAIAREVGLSIPAVGHWRKRYLKQGLAGLYGEQRPGRPRDHDAEAVARLLATVLQSRPSVGTHWTLRGAAEATGISKSTVQRYLRLFGSIRTAPRPSSSRPTRCSSRRSGTSWGFTSTRQIMRSSCASMRKARSRRSSAPNRFCRWGSATSTASPTTTSGTVRPHCLPPSTSPTARCWPSARRATAIRSSWRSSNASTRAVPAGLDVHLIVDNYATHKHPKVRAWLAERARFHVHYTPTYASWLNQVERWFAILTSREIRRGSFASAKDLVARITAFVAAYNTRSQPFTWTATADAILAKLARLCNVISGTLH